MEKPFELAYTELKKGCFPEELSFRTTAEIEPLEGVIGQERAVKAFDFGLAVKMKGYNIYMAGPSGTGKTTYARNSTEKLAQTEPVPYDWCYVYNFQKPFGTVLRAGTGQAVQGGHGRAGTAFQNRAAEGVPCGGLRNTEKHFGAFL